MLKKLLKKIVSERKSEHSTVVETNVPGMSPIPLKDYYEEFVWYYPNCEPVTKKWFVDNVQKNWHIMDCGANVGYYSVLFSRLAPEGKIYAFEPTETVEKLKNNLAYNKVGNVSVYKKALGLKCGKLSDGIYRIWGKDPEVLEYDFTSIDEFVKDNKIEKLDCIKIDVDSFDFEVLQGAEQALAKFDPYVVVELNHALNKRNQSNAAALEWIMSKGYKNAICLEYENFVFKKAGMLFPESPSISIFFKTCL